MIESINDEFPYVFDGVIAEPGSVIACSIDRGRREGKADLVLRLLRVRFRRVSRAVTERVNDGSKTDLQRWAERLLTAGSLAEVFAADPSP